VLSNLCAAAHKCAARAVEVCRARISEIKSFQWEVSLKFSTLIENVQFAKFRHGTLLPLHHNIIWSLNCSSVIRPIFDDLFWLSLYGRCLSSLDRHDLLPKLWTTIIIQHWGYASVDVEPDIAGHFLSLCLFYLISKTRHNKLLFPKFKYLWQKLASLSPTRFLWPTDCKEGRPTADWQCSLQKTGI